MAKGNREVNLVIRAKNEASKALDSINKALNDLTVAQRNVGSGAGDTANKLQQLGSIIAELNRRTSQGGGQERLARDMQEASRASAALSQELAELVQKQKFLNSEVEKSARGSSQWSAAVERMNARAERLKSRMEAAASALKEATNARKRDEATLDGSAAKQAKLQAAIDKLAAATEKSRARVERLTEAFNKSSNPSQTLTNNLSMATSRLDRLNSQSESARGKLASFQGEVSAAAARLGSLAQAEEKAAQASGRARAEYERAAQNLERYRAKAAELASINARLRGSQRDVSDQIRRTSADMANAEAELRELGQTSGSAEAAQKRLAGAIRGEVLRSLRDTKNNLKTYREEWKAAEAAVRNARLTPGAKPSEIRALTDEARRLKERATETERVMANLRAALRNSGLSASELARISAPLRGALDRVKAGANGAGDRIDRLGGSSDRARRELDRLRASQDRANASQKNGFDLQRTALSWTERMRSQMVQLALAYVGFNAAIQQVNKSLEVMRATESAASRLNVAFEGQTRAGTEMQWVKNEAKRLGIEVGVLANEYSKLAIATKGSSIEGQATRDIFLSVAEAARVSKLSLDEVKGAFTAISQMASKGTISMEELRQQLGERIPGAFTIAANGMGMSTKKLSQLIATGQVAAEDFLPKFAAELRKVMGPGLDAALASTTAQMGYLENNMFLLRERFNDSGFIAAFTNLLRDLNRTLESDAAQQYAQQFGRLAGAITSGLAVIGPYAVSLGSLLAMFALTRAAMVGLTMATGRLAVPLRAARVAAGDLRAVVAQMRLTAASTNPVLVQTQAALVRLGLSARAANVAVSRLIVGFRALWAAMGGWVGLALTAIVAGTFLWLNNTEEVLDTTETHAKLMEGILKQYDQVTGKVKDWEEALKGVTTQELGKAIRDGKARIEEARKEILGSNEATDVFAPVRYRPRADTDPVLADWLGLATDRYDGNSDAKSIQLLFGMLDRGAITYAKFRENLSTLLRELKDVPPEMRRALEDMSGAINTAAEEEGKRIDFVRVLLKLEPEFDISGFGLTPAEEEEVRRGEDAIVEALTGEGSQAAEIFAKNVENATGAIQKMAKQIPRLRQEAVYLEKLDSIEEIFKSAEAAAEAAGMADQLARVRQEARRLLAESQITDSLVDRLVGRDEDNSLDYQLDRNAAKQRAEQIAVELQDAGQRVSGAGVMLVDMLGIDDAIKILSAKSGDLMESIVEPDALQRLLSEGLDVSSQTALLDSLRDQITVSDSERERLELERKVAEAKAKTAEAQRNYNQSIIESTEDARLRLQIERETLEAGGELSVERQAEFEIIKAQNVAKRTGMTLDQATLDSIRERVALERELAELKKDEKDREAELNRLQAMRRDMLSLISYAEQQGDTASVNNLKTQLSEIEVQLGTAIDEAIAFWKSVGGPEADAAILRLEVLKNSLVNVREKGLWPTKKDFADLFKGAAESGVDGFIESIKETGDVINSLKATFRQFAIDFLTQMAKMIAQQVLFNALKAAGGGMFAGLFHDGGVVGSGGGIRAASPSWFNNAVRYHSGGIAGLRPNEVPAILERGEEVLTENDPRHRDNVGGAAPNIKVVNAIDPADFVSKGLEDVRGQKAILNFIQANQSAVKGALG